MTDSPETTKSTTATNVANGAKIAGIVTLVAGVLPYFPYTVDLYALGVFLVCGGIVAAVPAPKSNKVLIALYTVVRIGAGAVKYAVPYMAAHLAKDADSESTKS